MAPKHRAIEFPQQQHPSEASVWQISSRGRYRISRAQTMNLHANGFGPLILGLCCFVSPPQRCTPTPRPANALCIVVNTHGISQSAVSPLLHPCVARARGAMLMHSLPWLPITWKCSLGRFIRPEKENTYTAIIDAMCVHVLSIFYMCAALTLSFSSLSWAGDCAALRLIWPTRWMNERLTDGCKQSRLSVARERFSAAGNIMPWPRTSTQVF